MYIRTLSVKEKKEPIHFEKNIFFHTISSCINSISSRFPCPAKSSFFIGMFLQFIFAARLFAFQSDSLQITVTSGNLSYSEISSLIDKNIDVILESNISSGDLQSLINLNPANVIVNASGHDYATLNAWLNSGVSIIADHTFPMLNLKSLATTGGDKVYVMARGFDVYDLETLLTNGVNIILDRSTSPSYLYSALSKYHNRIYIDTNGFSIFELNDLIKYGASLWISSAYYTTDIRQLIQPANRYGGKTIIAQGLSYFDLKILLGF